MNEQEWIDRALQYGKLLKSNWQWGKIIVGEVTPAFIEMVLGIPKPTDTELFNKMTPFFCIFLDDIFCSEHYGMELYQKDLEQHVMRAVLYIVWGCFSVCNVTELQGRGHYGKRKTKWTK